jgi:hypothetical protein
MLAFGVVAALWSDRRAARRYELPLPPVDVREPTAR